MKKTIYPILALVLLAACAPAGATSTPDEAVPTPEVPPLRHPWAPQAGDSELLRGRVYIDSAELLVMESFPLQFTLRLTGSLPTPCHSLRVAVAEPDANNRIAVEAYSVVKLNMICTQVLEPFEAGVPLGSFPAGHYTVEINGEQAAEFDA
jgi:hypothetical protein